MSVLGQKLRNFARLAALGAAVTVVAAPAMADSFYFAYGHAPPSWRHYHPRHHHYYAWGPPVVFVVPPPVVYGAPPPVAPMSVTPTSEPYRTADGRYCREYQTTVMVGGRPQPSYGMACQMPDGTWHIMN